jgi:glycine/D-amino acid oxidase-like deaminating enzyme
VCTLNPGKLVREEKKLVESLGVKIYENTSVNTYRTGRTVELVTPGGRVNARNAVMATNAYSGNLKIRKNRFIPIFSYIVLTEPLSPVQIAELGWPGREAILEKRVGIHYLRLTADNRLLVGGRDWFYYMGDSLDSLFGHESQPRTFARLESYMHRVFPSLKDVKITHRWGGPFSVTLNLLPNIGYLSDEKNIVSAFGYSGSGIAQSFNSGQILRDLLFQPDSEFMELPFVNAKSPYAFSGPFRYLVVNGAIKVIKLYDWLTDN